MTKFGFSLYAFHSFEGNKRIVEKYVQAGFSFVFTSLNIASDATQSEMHQLLHLCRENGLDVMVDINETVLSSYGVFGLKELGITHVRVDDGLTMGQIADLSKEFHITLNASTLNEQKLHELQQHHLQQDTMIACHNYYPKVYTGLSVEKVNVMHETLHKHGINVMMFIAGEQKRMPLFEGLPTIEAHRKLTPLQSALECMVTCQADYICVGDTMVSDTSLASLTYLVQGIVPIRANVDESLKQNRFTNRLDASEYVIRVIESRKIAQTKQLKGNVTKRVVGDIVMANSLFGRYEQEIEICLQDLPEDARQEVIGCVIKEDIPLLPYLQQPLQFMLV